MSNQNVNSLNNYAAQQYFQSQNPNETVKQAANNTYVNNRLNASKDMDPLTRLGLTAAIGYGIGQGMDYFGPKCEGKYENTILGKLGGWGDKFSRNTKLGRFIESKLAAFDTWFNKKAAKPGIAYTLKYQTAGPSKGTPWNFARMPWQGLTGFLSADLSGILQGYVKPIAGAPRKFLGIFPMGTSNNFMKLEQYDKYYKHPELIEQFKNSLKGKEPAKVALELQKEELRCLGMSDRSINGLGSSLEKLQEHAKELKVKRLGYDSVKQFETVMADAGEHTKEIMAAMEKATAGGKDIHFSIWRGGKVKNNVIGRIPSYSEYLNKYKAAIGKGSVSHIGRALPKYLGWITEGCTNRFAGGKLAPFMQAAIFADMAYHTYKAPKGEHFKTMAERFVNDFSYFAAMTLGLIGLYKVADFKNIGLTVNQIKAKNAAKDAVNEINSKRGYAAKKLWKDAKKAVNDRYKPTGLKWYHKVLKKVGEFVDMGNGHFKPYRSPKNMNMNLLRRIANTNLIGVPLRLWLVIGVASPFIAKIATKAVHLVFGKPTHSVLDEDKEEEEMQKAQEAQQQAQLQAQQLAQQKAQQNPQAAQTNPNNMADSNLIKQTVNGQPQNSQNTNNQQQNTQNNTVVNNNQNNGGTMEPTRTYIPSPVGYVEQAQDATAANKALADADSAEQQIAQIMATVKKN